MKREFSTETLETILTAHPSEIANGGQGRTPLHVPYWHLGDHAPAQPIDIKKKRIAGGMQDQDAFNAIGSKLLRGKGHKPVLDIDGGAHIQEVRDGSKVAMIAVYRGKYKPTSMLRDVLGDNGIDAEVFTKPVHKYGINRDVLDISVSGVALRTKDKQVFEAVDSTTKNHSHLYIQQEFSDSDHTTLIQELGALGIISEDWQKMTEQEGMGILRTPWTEKAIYHRDS